MSAPLLFKVLRADGSAPHVGHHYVWSLPCEVDGVTVPGHWHEESTDGAAPCVRGLHLTAYPAEWGADRADRVTWVVEAEGVVGDPVFDDKVIAARVRIMRRATAAEVDATRTARLDAQKARYKRERAKELSERAKRAAKRAKEQREEIAVARNKGVKSPAQHTFAMLEAITGHSSWREINSTRYEILSFLVRHVAFEPGDFGAILNDFNGGRWIGENGAESLYALAIGSENTSAVLSIEKYLGRKPFWQLGWVKRGKREKTRVHLGSEITIDGRDLRVTSFRDDKGYLNAQEYRRVKRDGYHEDERVGGVVRVTHAQLLAGSTKAASVEASP